VAILTTAPNGASAGWSWQLPKRFGLVTRNVVQRLAMPVGKLWRE
jgi:hypothetical protein